MAWDRDPLLIKIGRHSTGAVHEILVPPPIQRHQVWVLELGSVYLELTTSDTTPDRFSVVYGVYDGKDYVWLHTRTVTSGQWERIFFDQVTLLTDYRPVVDILEYPANLHVGMKVIGYIRSPFTSP